jgi:hypothetical protein
MPDTRTQLRKGFFAGVKKGGLTFFWLCQIIIPISFLMTLLQWSGWLNQLDFLLVPLTGFLKLPPEAAFPIISGMLINLYTVIAIMAVIPFTIEQMTLIAVFSLIAHALILEGIIQHKTGLNIFKAALFRIGAAVLAVLIVSQFLGDTSQSVVVPVGFTTQTPVLEVLKVWAISTAGLLGKILGIIMAIMIVLESLRTLGWMGYLIGFFRPLMKIAGLSDQTAMMFVAANIFGFSYSAAVIIEEAQNGALPKEDLEHLHISIGINHAMVEDPLLLTALGLNPIWMWVPRFVMAVIMVQGYRAMKYLKAALLR